MPNPENCAANAPYPANPFTPTPRRKGETARQRSGAAQADSVHRGWIDAIVWGSDNEEGK
jgi:hypothetical protein